jgi:hypothetical protein
MVLAGATALVAAGARAATTVQSSGDGSGSSEDDGDDEESGPGDDNGAADDETSDDSSASTSGDDTSSAEDSSADDSSADNSGDDTSSQDDSSADDSSADNSGDDTSSQDDSSADDSSQDDSSQDDSSQDDSSQDDSSADDSSQDDNSSLADHPSADDSSADDSSTDDSSGGDDSASADDTSSNMGGGDDSAGDAADVGSDASGSPPILAVTQMDFESDSPAEAMGGGGVDATYTIGVTNWGGEVPDSGFGVNVAAYKVADQPDSVSDDRCSLGLGWWPSLDSSSAHAEKVPKGNVPWFSQDSIVDSKQVHYDALGAGGFRMGAPSGTAEVTVHYPGDGVYVLLAEAGNVDMSDTSYSKNSLCERVVGGHVFRESNAPTADEEEDNLGNNDPRQTEPILAISQIGAVGAQPNAEGGSEVDETYEITVGNLGGPVPSSGFGVDVSVYKVADDPNSVGHDRCSSGMGWWPQRRSTGQTDKVTKAHVPSFNGAAIAFSKNLHCQALAGGTPGEDVPECTKQLVVKYPADGVYVLVAEAGQVDMFDSSFAKNYICEKVSGGQLVGQH